MSNPSEAHSTPPEFIRRRRAWMVKRFERHARGKLQRSFSRVRITRNSFDPRTIQPATPVVFYGNHSSWWDPLLALGVRERLYPGRTSFAPIDAQMLEKYGIFQPLGFFGVDRTQPTRAARQFLRDAKWALDGENRLLFLTPQGRFADARERPLTLEPGLSGVLRRMPEVVAVPMAIEYVFWEESQPEILLHIGEPVRENPTEALEKAQDELAIPSIARDAKAFDPLFEGSVGIGGIYGLWQKLTGQSSRHSDL